MPPRRAACWLVVGLALAAAPAVAAGLRPFGTGLPAVGQWRDGFDLADLDGDGRADLIHGPPRKGAAVPVVFLGDGRGGWRRWTDARFPPLPYAYGDARAADLDGDGALDLVLAMHLRGVAVLRGDGHGSFTPAPPLPGLDGSFSSLAVAVTDWDGDGRPDVLAFGEGPRPGGPAGVVSGGATGLRIWLARGDGWEPHDDGGSPLFGRTLALGDFDGDGHPEVVTGTSLLGRTDLLCTPTAAGGCLRHPIDALPGRAYVRAVATGDVDGDGRDEIAMAAVVFEAGGPTSVIDLLGRDPAGTWTRRRVLARPGLAGASALALGDLDGDHRRDLVAISQGGEIWVFRNDGHGALRADPAAAPPPFAVGCGGSHVALADLDGDGRDEIVAAFADEPRPDQPERCPGGGGLMAWTTRPD
jgi:FG-GAP-like repeat/FG-GAP repeat